MASQYFQPLQALGIGLNRVLSAGKFCFTKTIAIDYRAVLAQLISLIGYPENIRIERLRITKDNATRLGGMMGAAKYFRVG